MKIALIGCSKKKLSGGHLARNLYQGTLFQKSLVITERLNFDLIYILSAKYGLLELDRMVEAYNEDLATKRKIERLSWSKWVKIELPEGTYFYFCGKKYWEFLPEGGTIYREEGIGAILSHLNQQLENTANIT